MKIDVKPLRYAHAEGHTDVCYSEDGQHIITCGHDGDVRIWVSIEDDDPNSHCVGESALAVCFKDKRLYVATDNHAVQAYTFPAFDKDGIVTRFTGPVTQIMSSSKIEVLGCTSENMEAKICSLEGGAPLFVMADHKGPVLSTAICPRMKYAATASGDTFLRIWDIDTQKVLKEINCVQKINTFFAAKVLCRMDFEPSEGKYLAFPNNREVVLLDCDTWTQRMTFTSEKIKCPLSQCLFSPCGQYLAGSTVAGQIAVWEVNMGHCVGLVDHPTSHNVTAMAWHPKGTGILVYCDTAGQLGALGGCYGPVGEQGDDVEMVERDDAENIDDIIATYESDDDAISLEKLKNETLGLPASPDSRPSTRQEISRPPPRVLPQPPFQPSATPKHLEHRYMCWNETGIVRCHTSESGESSIDVEFHDTTKHHGLTLSNYLNHTMASLSDTVLALACETPSKLVCISLIGSSKEWTVSMSDTEEILCVCAGAAVVAVATDMRLLRLYTVLGTQRQVICLGGPVVSVAASHGAVAAAYHGAEPGEDDQHLTMDIVAVNGRHIRTKSVPLPLSPKSKLSWLGFTDAGSPAAHDSRGRVAVMDLSSGCWLPVADTGTHVRGAADTWFVVSVSEPSQTVRGILCRGSSFPVTAPKPIVTEIPIQIPLCELDTEKGGLEERLVRWAHIAADNDVKAARETALKLFALACRSEIEARAMELMELLHDPQLVPLAAKYAGRLGRHGLAGRLADMAEHWQGEAKEAKEANQHFEHLDAHETYDVTNPDAADMNASLIIPIKEKEKKAVNNIKPAAIKAYLGIKRNPFKKQQESTKNVPSPLSLTDRNLVTPDDAVENHDPSKPLEGESFVDWFGRNKAILETEHPEFTPSELTKHGIKTFKTMSKSETEGSNKRKLEEESNSVSVANARKQSKLSAFMFQKKTEA